MIKFATVAVIILCASASSARNLVTDEEAALAGAVLGAEEPCGLSIDLDAMDAWFDAAIPPGEAAEFARNVQVIAGGQKYMVKDMSESQRRLHCRAIRAKLRDAGWSAESR